MAADSDGLGCAGGGSCGVVVTCEGDLRDPRFPARLRRLLRDLRALLAEPHPHTLKVNKVEPWNSVRVTLSVPRAAAARLRALAAAGAPQLRELGILSVQLDGDAAVSLRLQHGAELRINTDPDDASTSRSTPNPEVLAGLGTIGRILSEDEGASTSNSSSEPARDNFKSPNTVCPMDGKIPLNIPTHSNERCEFPFGSMTQARVIHRKENTLGITGPTGSIRPSTDGPFARPSTSTFPGPPPPYPAGGPPAPPPAPPAPPTVAMSSPLLVNLLQNDAPAPQPRTKPPHPAKLDRLEDGQVELAVGRPPFTDYRPRLPLPPSSPLPRPPRPSFIRRPPPVSCRPPPAPPPYRAAPRPRPVNRVTQEDLQALLPPTAAMDQKTQSSVQEFQRYQQQYVARQRAASRNGSGSSAADWNEPYRDSLSLLDLPDSDLEHLMPTLGDVLNMDDSAFSAMSDLDAAAKLDLLLAGGAASSATPDSLFHDITGEPYTGDLSEPPADVVMPPPPVPLTPVISPKAPNCLPVRPPAQIRPVSESIVQRNTTSREVQLPPVPSPAASPANLPRVHTATVGSQATAKEIEEQNKRYLIKTLMRDDASPPPQEAPKAETPRTETSRTETPRTETARKDTPRTETPRTETPRTETPRTETPRPETPRTETPRTETPRTETPRTETPRPETPRTETPRTETPRTETPRAETPKIEAPPTPDVKPKTSPPRLEPPSEGTTVSNDKRPDDNKTSDKTTDEAKRLEDDKKRLPRKDVVRTRVPPRDKRDKPEEKESIKLRLKLDKNEPVVQPVYKADVTFLNPPKPDAELRVPPLHISLRGRNSAVIKNSRKEKKKLIPGDPHSKKIKSRKSSESDERSHRRDSDETAPLEVPEVNVAAGEETPEPTPLKMNNHVGEAEPRPADLPPEDTVVFRMKTISKNAHIVTKHEYKLNRLLPLDAKKKKLKILNETKAPERERDKEWRTESLDEEGKYAQNEGYRETEPLPPAGGPGPAEPGPVVEASDSKTVQSDANGDKTGASDTDSKLLKCDEELEWTLGTDVAVPSGGRAADARGRPDVADAPPVRTPDVNVTDVKMNSETDDKVKCPGGGEVSVKRPIEEEDDAKRSKGEENSLKRTVDGEVKAKRPVEAEASPPAPTPNGVVGASPPRSPPPSPRRRERAKDKSYCKLVAERAARPDDKFGGRSPASQAQGEDSGIESMDALSEKSPNQASQSPPARKERLELPRSTSPATVQRIIGAAPPLLARLPRYEPRDIEAELADLHGEPGPPPGPFDPPPSRPSPPRYTYSNPDKLGPERDPERRNGEAPPPPAAPPPPDLDRLPLKADFPDKSLLEQLLIEIPAAEYGERGSSESPAARSSVRTRSATKLASPGLVPKAAPRRRRRESEGTADGAASPGRRKRARAAPPPPAAPRRKDSDSDSDEPLICKVRGAGGAGGAAGGGGGARGARGVLTRRAARAPPPRRATRSADAPRPAD